MIQIEFDVWASSDGRIIATPATKQFVDDTDAPYTYHRHELRVTASSRRDAVARYNALR